MCSAASYQHSVPSLKRSCVTCPFSSLSIIGSIFYPLLVCVQYSVFVLPFRDATVGVVPAFVSVAQARVRHAPVGVIPAFVSVAPALVRDVPGGVIPALGAVDPAIVRDVFGGVVPALGAVAQALVRDVPFFVSFHYRFHFLSFVSLCAVFRFCPSIS